MVKFCLTHMDLKLEVFRWGQGSQLAPVSPTTLIHLPGGPWYFGGAQLFI